MLNVSFVDPDPFRTSSAPCPAYWFDGRVAWPPCQRCDRQSLRAVFAVWWTRRQPPLGCHWRSC